MSDSNGNGNGAARHLNWSSIPVEQMADGIERQIDRDGGYFMASHNYHRSVVEYYLWASRFAGPNWNEALARSVDFLRAHMNPVDGCA